MPLVIITEVNAQPVNEVEVSINPDGIVSTLLKFVNAVLDILVIPELIVKLHPVAICIA